MIEMLQTTMILGDSVMGPDLFGDLFGLVLKAMFLIGALLYLVFSLIVVRQIHIMKNTLITKRYNTNSYESTFGNHTILEQHGNHVKQVLDYCFFSEISHKPSNVNISTT